ncbi:drug/metabolite transporter (DMT)-like permease [Rhodopseudomonas julia]|uniref:Drug/metabolite transporter (DMT)-like permease n=1 Tax=Rhodopseudomonas julia TaxID=200617 RepID=A0ABU0C820_9BRAD|nr:DMT family transporter [Rhodopseudomonas julia]MDQ0326124.1 drug/metabolite transporter (DMT)-like permease [Rhodopseudomonas julia]
MKAETLPAGSSPAASAETSLDLGSLTLLVLLSILWGGSFLFMRVAGAEIPVFTLVLLRVGIAAAALWVVIIASGRRLPSRGGIYLRALLMGFLNNAVPFSLITFATVEIGAGAASILNATTPIFTVLIAHLLTADEKMTTNKVAGVVLGFLGVAVMIGLPALRGLSADFLAVLAMLAAATSYGFSAVVGKGFRATDPVVSAALQLSASTLLMVPVAFLVDRPFAMAMPDMAAILSILGLALLSTAFAYVLFFRILARAGGTNAMLVTLLVPVSAVTLGVALLGESLSAGQFAGMAMIGAGLVVLDGRALRRLRRG